LERLFPFSLKKQPKTERKKTPEVWLSALETSDLEVKNHCL